MTTIDRNVLLLLLTLVGLAAVPMAFAGARGFTDPLAFPIIVGIELTIYFLAAMAINARATIGQALGTALVFTVVRAVCSLFGGVLASLFTTLPENYIFTLPWLNPIVAVIQILILVTAGPYVLALVIPEMVGRREADILTGRTSAAGERASSSSVPMETSPTGGFIQVFSFQELAAQLKKNPGLEGFIIFNDEGLVVWRDLPLRVDTDALACRIMNYTSAFDRLMTDGGLARMKRCILQSRDHYLMTMTLNQNFGLILLFSGRTPMPQIHGRIDVITKSTREFLQWKYPSLPMATGMTKDRIPLEMV